MNTLLLIMALIIHPNTGLESPVDRQAGKPALQAAGLSPQLLQARLAYGRLARLDLIAFAQLTSPLPSDPLNVAKSKYRVAEHHKFIARQWMDFGHRRLARKNLMLSIPYRHGKTEISVRKFVPWLAGNFPERSGIVITHTDTLAHDLGRDCRDVFDSGGFRTAFPEGKCQLRTDSRAMDRLQTVAGGTWMFTGRGGMGGGFGADWILIDDFFKNAEEARSQATRDHAWHCLISDCYSRLNEEIGGIGMIGTRKNEDDPPGRILDPTNIHFDQNERDKWEVIRLPALAEPNDPLGRELDEPLWPERFSKKFWVAQRENRSELVREDFQVQGQCNPMPTEGKVFKKAWLKTYDLPELPKQLRMYGASDHAVRKGQTNDRQCLLSVGIDASGTIWVLPDTFWEREDTLVMTQKMIELFKKNRPLCWFAAKDAISGSIGPFLRKMMLEGHVHQYIEETTETKDLQESRVVSIRNWMAMGMVRFPKFWPKWLEAEQELINFPSAKHDDLVAALALLGMGLDKLLPAEGQNKKELPAKGTMAWHTWGQRDVGSEKKAWT